MSARRVKLDHRGIAEVLKSAEVAARLSELATAVEASASADDSVVRHGVPVKVESYETDRAAVAVTLAHAGGLGIEAKHGTLSRAAGDVGLEVRSRS